MNELDEISETQHLMMSVIHEARFGIASLVDWDKEAMTEIEGIRSGPFVGIDRKPSQYWRSTRYGISKTEGE